MFKAVREEGKKDEGGAWIVGSKKRKEKGRRDREVREEGGVSCMHGVEEGKEEGWRTEERNK